MANFFGGLLGKAESNLKGRRQQLEDQEKAATGESASEAEERKKKNEQAAEGKSRLSASDKKY